MAAFLLLLGVVLAIVAYKCYDSADKIENRSYPSQDSGKTLTSVSTPPQNNNKVNKNKTIEDTKQNYDDSEIKTVERYSSWSEYKQKHFQRAKEIRALGIDLSSKSDQDASEWIFAIETTAHDSNCKISELKRKYFEAVEVHNPTDADWIYAINGLVEVSKKESQKYNLKVGNTAADMMLLFIFDKIKEIETKYASSPQLTTSDPLTLQMRFMLDSHDDVLMLQKMHIYLRRYPMTERNRKYRDNWHNHMMEIIEKRVAPYENLKNQPVVYNLAVSTAIFKLIHDEILKEAPQELINEFNSHLLSFHEEMEIISEKASEKYKI